jgi:hypothetical protein
MRAGFCRRQIAKKTVMKTTRWLLCMGLFSRF